MLPHSTFRELGAQPVLDAMVDRLGLPMMVKPEQGGSALGAQVVRDAAELPAAMVGCLAYGETVLAEQFVEGVEVAVDGDRRAGRPGGAAGGRDRPGERHLRLHRPLHRRADRLPHAGPARRRAAAAVAELAVAAHRLLGLRDVSRTDAIVAADGTVYFLEVNSSPGLTETSLLPMAVEVAGRSLGDIYAGSDRASRSIAHSVARSDTPRLRHRDVSAWGDP